MTVRNTAYKILFSIEYYKYKRLITTMSYFPIMSEAEFNQLYPDVAEEVCSVLGMGFVPNIFRAVANVNPELALASWVMVRNNLCGGELPRASKEILVSYIAYRRSCKYCHVAHHAMALKFGHDEQDIMEIINNIDSVRNPVLKAVLKFGEMCLQRDFNGTPELYEEFEDFGLDSQEISELIGMVSCALYMVNLADGLVVDIDTRFTEATVKAA